MDQPVAHASIERRLTAFRLIASLDARLAQRALRPIRRRTTLLTLVLPRRRRGVACTVSIGVSVGRLEAHKLLEEDKPHPVGLGSPLEVRSQRLERTRIWRGLHARVHKVR